MALENAKVKMPKAVDKKRKIQKNVEYMADNSFLSSFALMNNFTIELLTPSVANDLVIVAKFRKPPITAMPGAPRNTEIILVDNTPRNKLTPTDKAFNDNTL